MSLIDVAKEECLVYDSQSVSDGRGGMTKAWAPSVTIMAAITLDGTPEMRVAQAQGVKAVYRVVTSRSVNLQYHDVFQRMSDGKVFRVTSDGDDNKTPRTAGLDMRLVTAEEWNFPEGD